MEFKSLKNIETSFKQIRLFGIVFVVMCTLITGYAVWNSYTFAEAQRQKIYVLDGGKSLMLALSQDLTQNRPVEAREHVMFALKAFCKKTFSGGNYIFHQFAIASFHNFLFLEPFYCFYFIKFTYTFF